MARTRAVPRFLTAYGPPHRALERRAIVTGAPGLRLRFYPGVAGEVRALLKDFARWLRSAIAFHHPVRVTVVHQATVMGLDGAPGWAAFMIPPDDYTPGDVVRIFLGGGQLGVLERHFRLDAAGARIKLAHDLAHEIVHYEQWRDGRTVSERGVNRRAATLVRRYLGREKG
jgi:hypothetical protein